MKFAVDNPWSWEFLGWGFFYDEAPAEDNPLGWGLFHYRRKEPHIVPQDLTYVRLKEALALEGCALCRLGESYGRRYLTAAWLSIMGSVDSQAMGFASTTVLSTVDNP